MEADWSAEIGGDAPVIDTGWPGWVDLASDAASVDLLSEVRSFSPLGTALRTLLHSCAILRSTKCDFWMDDLASEAADPDAQCPEDESCHRLAACYVDLLPQHLAAWTQFVTVERWTRAFVSSLRPEHCPHARAEIILREASSPPVSGFGISLYLRGCGTTDASARAALERALDMVVRHICAAAPPLRKAESALQWQQGTSAGE